VGFNPREKKDVEFQPETLRGTFDVEHALQIAKCKLQNTKHGDTEKIRSGTEKQILRRLVARSRAASEPKKRNAELTEGRKERKEIRSRIRQKPTKGTKKILLGAASR